MLLDDKHRRRPLLYFNSSELAGSGRARAGIFALPSSPEVFLRKEAKKDLARFLESFDLRSEGGLRRLLHVIQSTVINISREPLLVTPLLVGAPLLPAALRPPGLPVAHPHRREPRTSPACSTTTSTTSPTRGTAWSAHQHAVLNQGHRHPLHIVSGPGSPSTFVDNLRCAAQTSARPHPAFRHRISPAIPRQHSSGAASMPPQGTANSVQQIRCMTNADFGCGGGPNVTGSCNWDDGGRRMCELGAPALNLSQAQPVTRRATPSFRSPSLPYRVRTRFAVLPVRRSTQALARRSTACDFNGNAPRRASSHVSAIAACVTSPASPANAPQRSRSRPRPPRSTACDVSGNGRERHAVTADVTSPAALALRGLTPGWGRSRRLGAGPCWAGCAGLWTFA
ncbi:hypothetical protein B0H17DRAFT_1180966 [Mycena rosella]|uniref:Uncharacterized protein n=1 Tax=Mycena rosella TaxID=1033263 RepID=A0AAD7DAW4_MYCRO|nr:hypothetical protein B0H17DRAFT_1180966 [Mycena rosella]